MTYHAWTGINARVATQRRLHIFRLPLAWRLNAHSSHDCCLFCINTPWFTARIYR